MSVFVNRPPTASAGGPYTGQAARTVQFYGGGSSDSDGTISSYRREFGDGTTGAGATPVHTYTSAGTYSVTLTVTDDAGASASAKRTAIISSAPASTASGTGTAGRLSKWLDGAGTLGDSALTDSGGNLGVGTITPQSALQVNGYIQLGLTTAMPDAPDCDQEAGCGRMKVDAINVKLYVCTAAGWKSAALQ